MGATHREEVLVYSDEGVDRLGLAQTLSTLQRFLAPSYYKIRMVDAGDLLLGKWKDKCALLVMPGGRDLPYVSKLGSHGMKQITEYVEKGGSYLGLCAGAYFASGYVEFQKGGPLEVIGERFLKFFPGHAVGPALGWGDFCYETPSGARAALISWGGEQLHTYYNGGCYFPVDRGDASIEVISSYLELENPVASIIGCTYGRGKALLSGVHFEFSPMTLDISSLPMQTIIYKLNLSEKIRRKMITDLLGYLGLNVEQLC